jgi:hypothetical protein
LIRLLRAAARAEQQRREEYDQSGVSHESTPGMFFTSP